MKIKLLVTLVDEINRRRRSRRKFRRVGKVFVLIQEYV